MQSKKSPPKELESKRKLFFSIGLLVACAFTLAAFEWRTPVKDISYLTGMDKEFQPIEEVVFTERKEEQPKKVKPPVSEIEEVDNEVETAEIDEFLTVDTDPVDIPDFPEKIEKEEDPLPLPPTRFPEVYPKFPGGDKAFYQHIQSRIKYPEIPLQNGVSGTVFVEFTVDVNGQVTNAKVVRGVDPYLDKEALRVVNSLPEYIPGQQGNRKVPVTMTIPVKFVIG